MEITKEFILKTAIEEVTQSAWEFASIEIWKNHLFTREEEVDIKKQIRKHFEKITIPKNPLYTGVKELLEFIVRVELTAEYLKRKPGRWIPHPVIWFNPNNPHGYVNTEKWYRDLKETGKYRHIKFSFENNKIKKTVG